MLKRVRKRSVLGCGLVLYAAAFGLSLLLKPNESGLKQRFPEDVESGIWISGNGTAVFRNEGGMYELNSERFSIEGITEQVVHDGTSPLIIVGEGYGAMVALALRCEDELIKAGDVNVVLIDPAGLPAFEWLGNPFLDRSLRSVQFSALWLVQRLLPFSYLWQESIQQGLFESSLVISGKLPEVLLRQYECSTGSVWIVKSEGTTTTEFDVFSAIFQPSSQIDRSDWDRALTEARIRQLLEATDPSPNSKLQASSIEPYLARHRSFVGVALGIAMLMIALSTLISEDLACIGSGVLVAHGGIGLFPAIAACIVGIYVGDLILYFIGRLFGEQLLTHRPFRWMISKDAVVASEQWFERRGAWVLIACRFLPGTRVPVYFAAGVLKFALWKVAMILGVAAILWVPLLVGLSSWIGERLLVVYDRYEQWAVWFLVVAVLLIFVVIHRVIPLLTHRGRRLAYSRWKRLTRWEFWPAKAIYPPVTLYILWLALRYRSLTLPTLSNPMLPCGGFIDESKLQILNQLRQAGAPVADFEALEAGKTVDEKMGIVRSAMERWGGGFPVVLKPDQGERGRGVVIVKTDTELEAALSSFDETLILQKYAPGKEFGVFYWRFPNQQSGEIPSITRKEYTSVTGDGTSTLEQLILNDKRAVCSAKTFLNTHAHELYSIPSRGQKVKLVEIGTHARGSLFLDACDLATPELLSKLDAISHRMDGYYLGRFDLKVLDDHSLQKGDGIQILELNLLTSEPTHMYDPRHSLFTAWKLLMRQWKTAFEIGDQVRAQGKKPMRLSTVVKLVWNRYAG